MVRLENAYVTCCWLTVIILYVSVAMYLEICRGAVNGSACARAHTHAHSHGETLRTDAAVESWNVVEMRILSRKHNLMVEPYSYYAPEKAQQVENYRETKSRIG